MSSSASQAERRTGGQPPLTPRRGPGAAAGKVALIALMALGSIAMWIAAPVGWLYLASRVADSSQPSMGPYLIVLFGIPITMVVIGKLLGRVNRFYGRFSRTEATVPVQMPWMRSMRGERADPRPRTVLDVVMVISVLVAVLAFVIWFFAFAGSSVPT